VSTSLQPAALRPHPSNLQFTSKMEGMVTDLQLGREKQQAFEEWMDNKSKKLPLDLNVTVLTTGGRVPREGGARRRRLPRQRPGRAARLAPCSAPPGMLFPALTDALH
jgi:hypothetical protein